MNNTPRISGWLIVLAGCCLTQVIWAWHGVGHDVITRQAVGMLPAEMPEFFRQNAAGVAHSAKDPDLFKKPLAAPDLHAAEAPEHYIDLELLQGAAWPPMREDYAKLCQQKGLTAAEVGTLPYAVMEWTRRLEVALAEYRKWPQDSFLQTKCLIYAGLLAHYAQDVCMPLHTTIHHDGRVAADDSVSGKGIHNKVDALPGKMSPDPNHLVPAEITPFADLYEGLRAEINRSHQLVDATYTLAAQYPDMSQPVPAGSPVEAYARQRARESAIFTARLYLTAWRNSEKIAIPVQRQL